MFHNLSLLLRAGLRGATRPAATAAALPLLREEIVQAAHAVQDARRATAVLAAQGAAEAKRLSEARGRHADIEARATQALSAGEETLALEAAGLLAAMETEIAGMAEGLEVYKREEARMRAQLSEAEARLRALERGSRVAEARALGARMQGTATPLAEGLEGAEERLRAIQEHQDLAEATRGALRSLQQEGQANAVRDKLAAAGFGAPTHTKAQDVLERLRAKMAAGDAGAAQVGARSANTPVQGPSSTQPAIQDPDVPAAGLGQGKPLKTDLPKTDQALGRGTPVSFAPDVPPAGAMPSTEAPRAEASQAALPPVAVPSV